MKGRKVERMGETNKGRKDAKLDDTNVNIMDGKVKVSIGIRISEWMDRWIQGCIEG